MTVLKCPIPGCEFATDDVEVVGAAAILNLHSHVHNAPVRVPAPGIRAPKLERPKVKQNSTTEEWNAFLRRWDTFVIGASIPAAAASAQLLECTTEGLGNIILRANPTFTTQPIADALSTLKSLAVIPVALGVLRSELASMHQDPDEPFRTYAARVQGKAETCEFKTAYHGDCTNCHTTYNGEVYYTDEVIRDVLLNGIADNDIRREALSTEEILKKSVTTVIAFVENRETARNANHPSSSMSSLSAYRRSQNPAPTKVNPSQGSVHDRFRPSSPTALDRSKTANCPDCGKTFHLFNKKARGWNRRPHSRCADCWKKSMPRSQTAEASSITHLDTDSIGQISGVSLATTSQRPNSTMTMDHHVFTKGEWRRAQVTKHPTVHLKLYLDNDTTTSADVVAITDSGAQSDLWSLDEFLRAGFSMSDLLPVSLSLSAANKSPIRIDGAFFGKVWGRSKDGTEASCKSMIYISRDVKSLYLSFDTMLALGILSPNFPSVGEFTNPSHELLRPNKSVCATDGEANPPCGCSRRTVVPDKPTTFPFPCSPENNEKMRQWLIDRYSSSVFNVCPHQPLSSMKGPPLEIHLKEGAKPVACHKAPPIPLHWQEKVFADLQRDEALGVIERVPLGEPVEWCHRMVVTRKHDGSPRRTVDLSPLNKHCLRETHNSESPFHTARRIPPNTWKTVTDAWNGYHSVPLRESDRPLTTFITQFGRWRYKRAPQGFLSSGDGYNQRFDSILANFERKERVVDDTVFYDTTLEEHWWRAIDFLNTVGESGMVLNADKFQFAKKEIEFAGLLISGDKIAPSPKFFDAIRDFPTPTSTTDIRSWFGLVNQVASYAQLRSYLEPFRCFLSPRHPFEWNQSLESAFQASKTAIIDAIHKGVEIFELDRPTCLRTDWSKQGIGYFLMQKHCTCSDIQPDCCADGWRITLSGSRFLSTAEQHYAPIEGEALAITWALDQTRYFTLGCHHLTVATDHKPLVKIFGDRLLDEISNTRLFRLKQRTLRWHFIVIHLPGKTNTAADATSRHPSGDSQPTEFDTSEAAIISSFRRESDCIKSITWEDLLKATTESSDMATLCHAVQQGFPDEYRTIEPTAPYWRYRHNLYVMEGVLLYDDRVVVPPSLRQAVLQALHSAHQGVSTMGNRARSIIFWPGMTNDIETVRQRCTDCIKNAPSQATLPSAPASTPSTPFEMVYADYFDCAAQHYLVVGDRLSGWCDVFKSPHGSPQAGSAGLITCLRNYFSRFGVPEELSSDGGPEFASQATDSFLSLWGVKHRISSAYHPKSNGRAEAAVKTTKRLLRSNTGANGSLDTDRFLRAMLQLRNTPDPDCDVSPSQIVFGRQLRDAFSFASRLEKFQNTNIRPAWRDVWQKKEEALRQRFHRSAESRDQHSRALPHLRIGDRCHVQNQSGNYPKRWDRSGTVMEDHGHDSYTLKVDGSGRVTRRNRQFLRRFVPASNHIAIPGPARHINIGDADALSRFRLPRDHPSPTSPPNEIEETVLVDIPSARPVPLPESPSPHTPVVEPCHEPPTAPVNDGVEYTQTIPSPCDITVDGSIDDQSANTPGRNDTHQDWSNVVRPRRMKRPPPRYTPETGEWN